jgi:hypothetical protein
VVVFWNGGFDERGEVCFGLNVQTWIEVFKISATATEGKEKNGKNG